MENISCLVLVEKEIEKVTKEQLKEVLQSQDGDLKRLKDFKDVNKIVWGYLCKVINYFRYNLTDMDKVILLVDENEEVYAYEHTGNFYPEHIHTKKVVGLMDENAEIEPTGKIY